MKLQQRADPKELRVRIFVVGLLFLLGLFVLAINLYRLMVVRYEEFLALSVDNQFKDVRVRAPRGLVRDRRGEVLVDSRPSFDVSITPAFCQKCAAEVIPKLAQSLAWTEEQRLRVESLIKNARGPQRYQPIAVQVDLTREEFDTINAHLFTMPGVDLEPVPHRFYRAGNSLSHVLGYMNEVTQEELEKLNGSTQLERPPYALGDYTGRRGVERSYEQALRGADGWVKRVVDARGQVVRDIHGNMLEQDAVAPRPGNNLVLSIDTRLQNEAERVFPAQAGSIVVMETKTGFIRAIVSRPGFDPNEMTGRVSPVQLAALSKDPLQPMVFRAGAEHYHPGSTFKVVTLLAALQSGLFTPTTAVSCGGGYRLGSRTWRCHKESGHGTVHAREAMQWSCDTFFYRVGDTLGIDPIAAVGKALGLGAPTNLSVAAEVPGVMPDSAYHNKYTPGGYTKGMALNTAIGQGDVNVTPLQLAVVYSAIANGGDVLQPQLVSKIETSDGRLVQEFKPHVVRHVNMTPEQQHIIVDALTAVVNEAGGTAFRIRNKDHLIAGKTGTAQVAKLGAVRLKKDQMDYFERDHAWFASFAPADDAELTVIVLNEHGGHGGSDAAPAGAAIYQKYFELKALDAQTDMNTNTVPAKPESAPLLAEPGDAGSFTLLSPLEELDSGIPSSPFAGQPLPPELQ